MEMISFCLRCGRNPVTHPLICDECRDDESQAVIARQFGARRCRTCGMWFGEPGDPGNCVYCGDPDPLDTGYPSTGEFVDDDVFAISI